MSVTGPQNLDHFSRSIVFFYQFSKQKHPFYTGHYFLHISLKVWLLKLLSYTRLSYVAIAFNQEGDL